MVHRGSRQVQDILSNHIKNLESGLRLFWGPMDLDAVGAIRESSGLITGRLTWMQGRGSR